MKVCPDCGTQYTDETLRFCLQDGASLVSSGADPTVSLAGAGPETAIRPASRPSSDSVETRWARPEAATDVSSVPSGNGGGSRTLAIVAAILALLVIVLVGFAGLWLFFGDSLRAALFANNGDRSNVNAVSVNNSPGRTPSPTPGVSTTASPSASRQPTPGPTASVEATHDKSGVPDQGIQEEINGWRSQSESGNVDGYMEHYAPIVDYYNRSGASKAFVRADKMRAFSRYSQIRVKITDLSWTINPAGDTATAVFDKEWDFRGTGNSSGKVRQRMEFRNINGRWLITGEHDVKVYYTN